MNDLQIHSPPMRVNIATSSNSTSQLSASKVEHQKSVLKQFSINQSKTQTDTSFQPDTENRNVSQTQSDMHQYSTYPSSELTRNEKHDHENVEGALEIPTPQLRLPDTWASQRSFASNTYARPHSCQQTDSMKQAAMIEPHMSHTLIPSPPSPSSHVTRSTSPLTIQSTVSTLSLRSVVSPIQDSETKTPGVMYNAWMVAKSNVPTKHTQLTASRLMTRFVCVCVCVLMCVYLQSSVCIYTYYTILVNRPSLFLLFHDIFLIPILKRVTMNGEGLVYEAPCLYTFCVCVFSGDSLRHHQELERKVSYYKFTL